MDTDTHKPGHFYFASESVGEGHPDKLCDQISDGILDACLKADPAAYVACETATKSDFICLLGEVTLNGDVDYEQVVRRVTREVGYTSTDKGIDCDNCEVLLKIEKQSTEIALSVHHAK
jgi:S-adenosylmethionine synthetase